MIDLSSTNNATVGLRPVYRYETTNDLVDKGPPARWTNHGLGRYRLSTSAVDGCSATQANEWTETRGTPLNEYEVRMPCGIRQLKFTPYPGTSPGKISKITEVFIETFFFSKMSEVHEIHAESNPRFYIRLIV